MKNSLKSSVLMLLFLMVPALALAQGQTNRSRSDIQQSQKRHMAGYEVKKGRMASGYNHPGGINTEGWDLFFNISFIYWEARQGGMSLGIDNSATPSFTNNSVVYQNFEYKPGFKISGGFKSDSFDDWGGKIEYTRLHGSYNTSATAPQTVNGNIRLSPWFGSQANITASDFRSTWDLDLDMIDFGLFRTYYVGQRLLFSTYFGSRWGWIDQRLNFTANIIGSPINPSTSKNSSDSWLIGPRAAINMNWDLGWGLRFVGNTALSVVYQKYSDIRHTQSETNNLSQVGISTLYDISFLRPNFDLQWGLGWGMYAWNQRVYFDFEATYDFMIWWAQNMMRDLAEETSIRIVDEPNSLYYHGLTLRAQLNF